MQTKPTPAEGKSSAKLETESALRDAACCPLPFYRDLRSMSVDSSWVVKAAGLIADSDFTPGLDVVLRLKSADGVLNDLVVSLRIPRESDTPRVIEGCGMNYLASVKWGETQIVDGVLLAFRRPAFLAELFVDAATHMDVLGKKFLDNVQA